MKTRLRTRLINYFMLIAFAAMLIGIEFYFELSRADLINELCGGTDALAVCADSARDGVIRLRNKIFIMFLVLTVVVAIVLAMFIRNITSPLQKMADVAEGINQGDLSLTVDIETHDEIGEVGMAINELTSNLQEVASLTSVTAMEAVEKIELLAAGQRGNGGLSAQEVEDIKSSLQSLIQFVDSFELLRTDIES